MPAISIPRLHLNRFGFYVYRLRSGARDQRISLGTKNPLAAHMIASKINEAVATARTLGGGWLMSSKNPKLEDLNIDLDAIRRYEINLKDGIFKADGDDDHRRLLEAFDKIGPYGLPKDPPTRRAPDAQPQASPVAAKLKSPMLSEVVEKWLAERKHKNAPRTVYAKQQHMKDFQAKIVADIEIDSITKPTLVGYKAASLAAGQTAKTVDNKLLSIADFFKYALANGFYTASDANPTAGLLIQTKTERQNKAKSYKAFSVEEIAAIFEPASYGKWAGGEPDLFWAPLIGAYSGMRVTEATGIHCEDVAVAPNGVAYIHVRKSKTGAGVRNVPIHQALLDLGFMEFVEAQRKAGHERLFPARKWINESYSKELGIAFRARLIEVGVRKKTDSSERKSFHSFRVNVSTSLANMGANTMQAMKIVGHAHGAPGIETHKGYVRDLPDLKEVVDLLAWPIDIAHLRSTNAARSVVIGR